jgi:hypothetical protein
MWSIEYTQEYEDWFSFQEEENKIAINAKVILLSEFGPQLGRPYVDTIHGSKYKNLKELRVKYKNTVFRILFCFNKNRNCWLILEKRKDIRISTLIEYLNNLGMGLEIKTFPKTNVKKVKEEILLRV